MRTAQRHIVNDEVVDVVGGGEDATTKETMGGTTAARKDNAAVALRTR